MFIIFFHFFIERLLSINIQVHIVLITYLNTQSAKEIEKTVVHGYQRVQET